MDTLQTPKKTNWTKWGVIIAAVPVVLALCAVFAKYHDRFANAKEVVSTISQLN